LASVLRCSRSWRSSAFTVSFKGVFLEGLEVAFIGTARTHGVALA
jgi:uncharacterized membrane protein